MSELDGTRLVRELWRAIDARDWARVESLVHPTFTATLPQSGERFDRARWLRLNRDYPGDWRVLVRTVLDAGAWLVSEVEVAIDGRTDRAISFFRALDGQVVELREFWPEPFPVPEWRRGWSL